VALLSPAALVSLQLKRTLAVPGARGTALGTYWIEVVPCVPGVEVAVVQPETLAQLPLPLAMTPPTMVQD
jgi:hypothetical protein